MAGGRRGAPRRHDGSVRRDAIAESACCGGMLKGRPGSDQATGPSDMAVAVDRPRKKLSFREPEIMGYYMQMKQGVTSRFSRKGKSSKAPKEKGLREAAQEEAEALAEVGDEEELEVGLRRRLREL